MPSTLTRVVDASEEHWRYISLCTHTDDNDLERLHAAQTRLRWLKNQSELGMMMTKVALDEDGEPLGFIHMIPIESPASGMIGKNLMVISCLTINYKLVYSRVHGTGVGRCLVEACEEETKGRGFKGIAVYAYSGGFWFMPSAFFQRLGFKKVSENSNIWVKMWDAAKNPTEPIVRYEFNAILGKVVIDYFWSPFCLTVCNEVLNVRNAVSEFGEKVALREYRTDDPEIAARYGLSRALFINGERKDWGYAAPKEELKKEIAKVIRQHTK